MFQEFPEDNKGDDFLNEFRQKIADQSSNNIQTPETLKFRLYADRRRRLKFSRANPAEWKFSIRTKASMTL